MRYTGAARTRRSGANTELLQQRSRWLAALLIQRVNEPPYNGQGTVRMTQEVLPGHFIDVSVVASPGMEPQVILRLTTPPTEEGEEEQVEEDIIEARHFFAKAPIADVQSLIHYSGIEEVVAASGRGADLYEQGEFGAGFYSFIDYGARRLFTYSNQDVYAGAAASGNAIFSGGQTFIVPGAASDLMVAVATRGLSGESSGESPSFILVFMSGRVCRAAIPDSPMEAEVTLTLEELGTISIPTLTVPDRGFVREVDGGVIEDCIPFVQPGVTINANPATFELSQHGKRLCCVSIPGDVAGGFPAFEPPVAWECELFNNQGDFAPTTWQTIYETGLVDINGSGSVSRSTSIVNVQPSSEVDPVFGIPGGCGVDGCEFSVGVVYTKRFREVAESSSRLTTNVLLHVYYDREGNRVIREARYTGSYALNSESDFVSMSSSECTTLLQDDSNTTTTTDVQIDILENGAQVYSTESHGQFDSQRFFPAFGKRNSVVYGAYLDVETGVTLIGDGGVIAARHPYDPSVFEGLTEAKYQDMTPSAALGNQATYRPGLPEIPWPGGGPCWEGNDQTGTNSDENVVSVTLAQRFSWAYYVHLRLRRIPSITSLHLYGTDSEFAPDSNGFLFDGRYGIIVPTTGTQGFLIGYDDFDIVKASPDWSDDLETDIYTGIMQVAFFNYSDAFSSSSYPEVKFRAAIYTGFSPAPDFYDKPYDINRYSIAPVGPPVFAWETGS